MFGNEEEQDGGSQSEGESVSGADALGEEPMLTQMSQPPPASPPPSPRRRTQSIPPQQQQGSDDEPPPPEDATNSNSRIPRKNAVQGLTRVTPGELKCDRQKSAPFFVVSFLVTDSTSLDRDMQELLWVLHNVLCCVEKGEPMGHMSGQTAKLRTRMCMPHMLKSVILSKRDDGSNGLTVPEMITDLRVHEARGAQQASPHRLIFAFTRG